MKISEAINWLHKGETWGPDGLPIEFYATFQHEIDENYEAVSDKIILTGEILDSWKEAKISLIHKTNSDHKEIKNYRPISLLNADYKVFTSILVERLKKL